MQANIIEAVSTALIIVMAVSPAIYLLCLAKEAGQKVAAIVLFVVSLVGFFGIYHVYMSNPPVVNNLYNYGDPVK